MNTMISIILASTSPRRRALLKEAGVLFEAVGPLFEETPTGLSTKEESLFFAEQKARSVASLYPNALILAADTLIDCNGIKMGKPSSEEDAFQMLKTLSGKTHQLYTAVVLLNTKTGEIKKHLEEVRVTFKPLSEKAIADYVASGESMGKAGAYAIQEGGKHLIKKVEGDIQAVIGLPLGPILLWLQNPL